MKKLIVLIMFLLLLVGCSRSLKPDFDSNFEVETYRCDMSAYDGMSSVNHHFLGTTVDELERTLNEKGYGIFVLSYNTCPHCKVLMQYMEEVCEELDVYIYYLDAYSKRYPIVGTDDYDRLFELMKPACEKVDGVLGLQTPTLFTIIDGKIIDHKIGAEYEGATPSEKEVKQIKQEYRDMMKPFVH